MDYLLRIFEAILSYLVGPLGKTFFSIAVVVTGYASAMGNLHWKWCLSAFVGAGIAFGGSYLVGLFAGV